MEFRRMFLITFSPFCGKIKGKTTDVVVVVLVEWIKKRKKNTNKFSSTFVYSSHWEMENLHLK